MLTTYELPAHVQETIHKDERIYFEGIFMTMSISTCEIMLGQAEIFAQD